MQLAGPGNSVVSPRSLHWPWQQTLCAEWPHKCGLGRPTTSQTHSFERLAAASAACAAGMLLPVLHRRMSASRAPAAPRSGSRGGVGAFSQKPRLVLGLDGVLCASAEEAAAAACEAATVLWPLTMTCAQDMRLDEAGVRQSWVEYDWGRFSEEAAGDRSVMGKEIAASEVSIPQWLLCKVQQLRPACDAEWELVLLARLCVEEALACRANRAKGRGGARPLTVGEVEANWVDSEGFGVREILLARYGTSCDELKYALAQARPRWVGLGSSLQSSPFYLEILEVVRAAVADGSIEESVHVVTSRDLPSAVVALQKAGEALQRRSEAADASRETWSIDYQGSWADKDGWRLVGGLGTVEEKADAVQTILTGAGDERGFLIIDDSVAFLRACASRLCLGSARLYLAGWGYVSHGPWSEKRSGLPRIGELAGAGDLKLSWQQQ